ncbi:hypothetical protein [Sandaracinus amylolyticus]|nr:hypothetical protein [Sandaracinus amylolyticus]
MRGILGSLLALFVVMAPSIVRADPPVEGPPVIVHGRRQVPSAFTTVARARPRDRATDPRADLVREVPRTVRRAPF